MFKRCVFLIISLLFLVSCSSSKMAEVEMYNNLTSKTVSDYTEVKDKLSGKEQDFIWGIRDGTVSSDWFSDVTLITPIQEELSYNRNTLISDEPVIHFSRFYTALGSNSVSHIMSFSLEGTKYLWDTVWSDGKIVFMSGEVEK